MIYSSYLRIYCDFAKRVIDIDWSDTALMNMYAGRCTGMIKCVPPTIFVANTDRSLGDVRVNLFIDNNYKVLR